MSYVVISSGHFVSVTTQYPNSYTVEAGGDLYVVSGGNVSATILSGGYLGVGSGSVAYYTSVLGTEHIDKGAVGFGTKLSAGVESVYLGGTGEINTIYAAGSEYVAGFDVFTTISGGDQIVSGGAAYDTVVRRRPGGASAGIADEFSAAGAAA